MPEALFLAEAQFRELAHLSVAPVVLTRSFPRVASFLRSAALLRAVPHRLLEPQAGVERGRPTHEPKVTRWLAPAESHWSSRWWQFLAASNSPDATSLSGGPPNQNGT